MSSNIGFAIFVIVLALLFSIGGAILITIGLHAIGAPFWVAMVGNFIWGWFIGGQAGKVLAS